MKGVWTARRVIEHRWLSSIRLAESNKLATASRSFSNTIHRNTAKYKLRKLDSKEISDLEVKIADYSQPQAKNSSAEALAPGATEADSVRLTESAIKRLKHLSEKRAKTQYLRLRVDSGGCYGFSYMLDMTEEPEQDDIIVDRDGAKLVIDQFSLPLVRGATIDWQDRLIGQAFLVVANPQSSGGCGCGSSFEIKLD
ncbi:[4Fe-4S] proteins maturation [Coemansia sp. RSA 2336]|nr:[4Fe-4S] proteins maturation [Coemansia sp. RSA 2336]KAJ2456489.1 [4Fe-4S] proteins maturation [Coemansia sp. RSA 2336]